MRRTNSRRRSVSTYSYRRLVRRVRERQQAAQRQRQGGVQRVEGSALHPLGDGGARVPEPELLQDVVHAVRLDGLAGPRQQPAVTT